MSPSGTHWTLDSDDDILLSLSDSKQTEDIDGDLTYDLLTNNEQKTSLTIDNYSDM